MTDLTMLKRTLSQKIPTINHHPLTDQEYSLGFEVFQQESGRESYHQFVIPQLSALITSTLYCRRSLSILEVGPGPQTVLAGLPPHLRQRIGSYTAFEPNQLFVSSLQAQFDSAAVLPALECPPDIRQSHFTLTSASEEASQFDVILFCHSLYGLHPKCAYIRHAVELLKPGWYSRVVVIHRLGNLVLEGLVCQATAAEDNSQLRVSDNDTALDNFVAFVLGFSPACQEDRNLRRTICRELASKDPQDPSQLIFQCPTVMMAFDEHATRLSELTDWIPKSQPKHLKNWEAARITPATVVKPHGIEDVQRCVKWSLRYRLPLTVQGGGHSANCRQRGTVCVDMSDIKSVFISDGRNDSEPNKLVIVQAGATTGDVIRKTMAAGLTVPLGSRPSVGSGSCLLGGMGHLSRLMDLACDAIVGAVLVSTRTGEIVYTGCVPQQYTPPQAIRADHDDDLLWCLKGAGTAFGIVTTLVFKAFPVRAFTIRTWNLPCHDEGQAQRKLLEMANVANTRLQPHCSLDLYFFADDSGVHCAASLYEAITPRELEMARPEITEITKILGEPASINSYNAVSLFDAELYMTPRMHGGHGGKANAFKRCVFLKNMVSLEVNSCLIDAVKKRPSPWCYLHLLQGGGAIAEAPVNATAFGCRDWEYACVVTGAWARDHHDEATIRSVIQWVYDVVHSLLAFSSGVYGADLGHDPRDAPLGKTAFNSNGPRLARLKHLFDPYNILPYTFPLHKAATTPGLIFLITGDHYAGKDFNAAVWAKEISKSTGLSTKVASISDETKRGFASAAGLDAERLIHDRAFKERHRQSLSDFFLAQLQERPKLADEHFLSVVNANRGIDVFFITGMREPAPVAALSHYVPDKKLIEVRVKANRESSQKRREAEGLSPAQDQDGEVFDSAAPDDCPDMTFWNDEMGKKKSQSFFTTNLLPLLDPDLRRLADMVDQTPDWPRPGLTFHHILGICSHSEGLQLCTKLLTSHLACSETTAEVIVGCEAGGFLFASAFAMHLAEPLVLIREAGKLPPPTLSVTGAKSHVTSAFGKGGTRVLEISRGVIPASGTVVVVEDVLATGKTLSLILQLLRSAGVTPDRIHVLVVAEFPIHGGRDLLRREGFGKTRGQSLLVFDGA